MSEEPRRVAEYVAPVLFGMSIPAFFVGMGTTALYLALAGTYVTAAQILLDLEHHREQQSERDHDLRECAETVEVKPGIFQVKSCDECRQEAYSLTEADGE